MKTTSFFKGKSVQIITIFNVFQLHIIGFQKKVKKHTVPR